MTMPAKFHFPPPPLPNQAELRKRVHIAEQMMLKAMADPGELHVEHYFAAGVYGRAIYIPKGVFLTGKIHKYPQINVLVSGDLTVMTEEGAKRVKPPFVVVSPAGTKRIAYANEDTVWLTLHGTHETDVDKIEEQFIAGTEEDFLAFWKDEQERIEGGQPCLGQT